MKTWKMPQIIDLSVRGTEKVCEPPAGYVPPNNGSNIQPNDVWCCEHNKYHGQNHCKEDHYYLEQSPSPLPLS